MSRLAISFSGGRTSAYMTKRILEEWRDRYADIVVLFANTGQEHEKTLEFVHNCDKNFGFNTVWVEAVVHHGVRKGCTAKVVTFETANRDGNHYKEAVKKYGIFNTAFPNCTDRLKVMPMRDYRRRVLGWKHGTYDQVIGIRADEIDRMSVNADKMRILYPLIRWDITKQYILDWWAKQTFDLDLPEHKGNCVWCWKKSDRKLFTLAKENPEIFDFPAECEDEFMGRKTTGGVFNESGFFRKNRTAKDIIAAAREPFEPWVEKAKMNHINAVAFSDIDISNGCSESCEVEYI